MSIQPIIFFSEDDDFAAVVTAEMLGPEFIIHHVENGQAALDFVAKQIPDLVLLDVSMPGLIQLIASARKPLHNIGQRYRQQRIDSKQIFQDLQTAFERRLMTIGITAPQEDELAELIQDAPHRALALYDEGLSIETHMENIPKQLESTGQLDNRNSPCTLH